MAYSIHDKIKYNKERKTPFSWGYLHGIKLYERRMKADKDERKRIDKEVDECHKNALCGDRTKGSTQADKGVMCGMRDMAQFIKGKKK